MDERKALIKFRSGTVGSIAYLLSLLIFLPPLPEATGQTSSQSPKKPKVRTHLQSAVLGREPELQYLAKYTSKWKRFRGGLESFAPGRGVSYQLRYETAETPDKVLDWYEGVLKSNGFVISEAKKTRLTAMHPDVNVAIFIMIQSAMQPGYDSRYKTHFTIRYVQQPSGKRWKPPESEKENERQSRL